MILGQITKSMSGVYAVEDSTGKIWQTKPRGLFRKDNTVPYVGDYVTVEPIEDDQHADNTGTITEIKKRENFLIRPPVANIDYMVLVVSTTDPVPNFVTLDKLLAVMENQNINTVIALSKTDLVPGDNLYNTYTKVGYKVFPVDNTGKGTDELVDFLGDSFCVFAGNTGTGKSSLLNAIHPNLDLQVGETSQKLGRGRHTTRHVEIHTLENGLRVADTPGFSSMDLAQTTDIDIYTLDSCFKDFVNYIGNCRFNDCHHLQEIGCGVKEAVKNGDIAESRYESYKTIYNELKNVKDWER